MPTRRETIVSAAAAGAAAAGLGAVGARAAGALDAATFAGMQPAGGDRGPSKLVVVWSNGDADVAHRVCLMYAHAAKTNAWFSDVHLIIWGPSQRILVGDKDLKAKIARMSEDGVVIEACIACANTFGLVEELRGLGLPVRGMGGPLTEALKDPSVSVVTF